MMNAAAGIFLAGQRRRGVKYIDGIDNNASPFNYTASTGMFDNAAVIDTGVIPNLSTYVKYSAYMYPIGSRTDGYVTGVYFGSQSGDDSYDSFWVRAFVPRSEGSSNLQARIGRYGASGFYSFVLGSPPMPPASTDGNTQAAFTHKPKTHHLHTDIYCRRSGKPRKH